MNDEKRTEMRERVALPVLLAGGATGWTRDVSASGLYFETEAASHAGGEIELAVEVEAPGRTLRLHCRGEVVRLESHGGRTGVAVKMLDARLASVSSNHELVGCLTAIPKNVLFWRH